MPTIKPINYPHDLAEADRPIWEYNIVMKCLFIGRKRFPISYPGIFDRNDIESAFMQGINDGLRRIQWDKGDPIQYLIASGIWRMRTERYRSMNKKFIIKCSCGRILDMGKYPCHNEAGELVIEPQMSTDGFKATIKGKPAHLIGDKIVQSAELATDLIEQYSDCGGGIEDDHEIWRCVQSKTGKIGVIKIPAYNDMEE